MPDICKKTKKATEFGKLSITEDIPTATYAINISHSLKIGTLPYALRFEPQPTIEINEKFGNLKIENFSKQEIVVQRDARLGNMPRRRELQINAPFIFHKPEKGC